MGFFYGFNFDEFVKHIKGKNMKEKKSVSVGVRLNETQAAHIQKLVDDGKAKSISSAIQYLINMSMITGE